MKLVMAQTAVSQAAEPGILLEGGSVALIGRLLPEYELRCVADVLESLPTLSRELTQRLDTWISSGDGFNAGIIVDGSDVRLRAPVGDRALIVGAAGNYREHSSEMGAESNRRAQSFIKSPSSVVGPGDAINLPAKYPNMVDYEGELCVVFRQDCHRVSAREAMSYVGGYTILNDISVRDGLSKITNAKTALAGAWAFLDFLQGKQFPTFAPIGPAVVTVDEVQDPSALRLITRVNDVVVQDGITADMEIAIPELISQISEYYCFRPGDVLSTGTPARVQSERDFPRFLSDGDQISVEVSNVGVLTNRVRSSALPAA